MLGEAGPDEVSSSRSSCPRSRRGPWAELGEEAGAGSGSTSPAPTVTVSSVHYSCWTEAEGRKRGRGRNLVRGVVVQ